MKLIGKIIFGLAIAALSLIISCGEDSNPEQDAINRLSKTWGNAEVMLDGVDVTTPSYDNFSITFRNDGSYVTTDGDPVFKPSGGFWSFSDKTNFKTISVDGVSMTVSLDAGTTNLQLTFAAPGAPIGARVEGLDGNYVFNLKAQ